MLGEALIIREVKVEDTGNYTCIAKSAGVSKAFAMSYVGWHFEVNLYDYLTQT